MKLIVLASHPVQYHAPVFRQMAQEIEAKGGECLVVYLSDFSIQGYRDREFNTTFAWDEPLLEGYRSTFLNANAQEQPAGFRDLHAPGWIDILKAEKPTRILVTTLNYQGAVTATLQARLRGIPCTLRAETTDVSVVRSPMKDKVRSLIYRTSYSLFDSAIAFGEFNRQHLIRHGISPKRLGMAYFSVRDRTSEIPAPEKQSHRQNLRTSLGFNDAQTVLLFSGKLIPKKNPELILNAIAQLPLEIQQQLGVIFLGSGTLAEKLQTLAQQLAPLPIHFAGFKNQQELPPYYLAADVLVLPSQRQGEVWGLVVNEALQAGLPCIVTEAVGCTADFANFPDFQIIPENDAIALAQAIQSLLGKPRDFNRYQTQMQNYSIAACAHQMAEFLWNLK
ncbi:glycosyltransferase family 4 protein [Kamptonema cortianum]|nr:glycosyltransferase family 4 protein [Kamptonema cortianum]